MSRKVCDRHLLYLNVDKSNVNSNLKQCKIALDEENRQTKT